MYVILVNKDNTLLVTNRERIMQRSKLCDSLWFLSEQYYKGYDLSKCSVMLEYILPVSRKYCTETLTLSEDRYNNYLKYELPFDTKLTAEAGKIEVQLTFYNADISYTGESTQYIRKTSTTTIDIIPISAWSDIIPDSSLNALDQRIIKIDAQVKALNDIFGTISGGQNCNFTEVSNEEVDAMFSFS